MKNKIMRYRSLLVVSAVLLAGLVITGSNTVSALTMPTPALSGGSIRSYTTGATDPSLINVGQNTPANPPAGATKPVPTFSALDTPIVTSSAGPVQIADDVIVHGIFDAKNGITSTNQYVEIYAPLKVATTTNKAGSGNIELGGSISNPGGTVTIASNLQLPLDKNLQVLGATSLNTLGVSGATALSNGLTVSGDTTVNKLIINSVATFNNLAQFSGNVTLSAGGATLAVAGSTQLSGSLTAYGSASFSKSANFNDSVTLSNDAKTFTVSPASTFNGNTTFNSNVTIGYPNTINTLTVYEPTTFNGNVTINGTGGIIKANKIGAYYRLDANPSIAAGANQSKVTLICGTGDIMISCQGHAGTAFQPITYLGSWFSNADGRSCYSTYNNPTVLAQVSFNQAICFNPDMSAVSGQSANINGTNTTVTVTQY